MNIHGEAIARKCSTMQKAFAKAVSPQLTALDKLRRALENSPRALAQRAKVKLTDFAKLCSMTFQEMLSLVQYLYERNSLTLIEQHSPPLLSRHLSSNAPPTYARTQSQAARVFIT